MKSVTLAVILILDSYCLLLTFVQRLICWFIGAWLLFYAWIPILIAYLESF